jgi:hypothetical protein
MEEKKHGKNEAPKSPNQPINQPFILPLAQKNPDA